MRENDRLLEDVCRFNWLLANTHSSHVSDEAAKELSKVKFNIEQILRDHHADT